MIIYTLHRTTIFKNNSDAVGIDFNNSESLTEFETNHKASARIINDLTLSGVIAIIDNCFDSFSTAVNSNWTSVFYKDTPATYELFYVVEETV